MVEELLPLFFFFKYAEELRYLYLEIVPYKFWETQTCVMAEVTMWFANLTLVSPHHFFLSVWKEVAEQNPSTLEADFGAD